MLLAPPTASSVSRPSLLRAGAHAVCPYLAFESCRQWRASPRTENLVKAGKVR